MFPDSIPIVAIIGKPNVGKSTLFNRFVGYRKAVVSPTPGTTRDRHYALIESRKPFLLVDTGGIESDSKNLLEQSIQKQASIAIAEAGLILFLVDSKSSITREDFYTAQLLRKSGKSVILVASKCDRGEMVFDDVYQMGFGEPMQIAAIHDRGIVELLKKIQKKIPKMKKPTRKKKSTYITIAGRPNVGKSSLINALLGKERFIVSEIQGTTIDSPDCPFEWNDQHFTLIDTAGIRRRGKISRSRIDQYSFFRSLDSLERADVAILLIDGEEGITAQDQHIADYILSRYCGLILAVNKIDLFEKGEDIRTEFISKLRYSFDFIHWAPVIFVSAKSGKNVEKIPELASEIRARRNLRIDEKVLQYWLQRLSLRSEYRLLSIRQLGISPPHFEVRTRVKGALHFSHLRYLENRLRENFDFTGTPIRWSFTYSRVRHSHIPQSSHPYFPQQK